MRNEKAESVIWVASYPKSGNTWVQAVTRAAGRSFGFPTEDVDVYKLKQSKKTPGVIGGVQPDVSASNTTILKTHTNYVSGGIPHPELGLKLAGFIYVMRNPLDMLLSYINFTRIPYERNQDNQGFRENLFLNLLGYEQPVSYEEWRETTLEKMPRPRLDYALMRFTELNTEIPGVKVAGGTWLGHCQSWHTAATLYPSVLFRYEDLLKGPQSFLPLQRLFTFSDKQILNAATNVDGGLRALQGKKVFFNKMSAYYYREFFSPEVIHRFLERYEADLRQLGYEDLYTAA